MANYECVSRTNYFRVTDEAAYQKLFEGLRASDLQDFTKTEDGIVYHGFGAYDTIEYVIESENDDFDPEYGDETYDFDVFLSKIQNILPDDEAFIYIESGHEKLRYITGYTIIVTKDKIVSQDLINITEQIAINLLGESFHTKMTY